MNNDTDLGGPGVVFPATHGSLVRSMSSADPAVRRLGHENLVHGYWKPIYKYVRIRWHLTNEDAKDLTQAFFVRALEADFFEGFDPSRARFRTYVRVCVDHFVANEQRAASRLKRGGGAEILSLDFESADGELGRQEPIDHSDPDDLFRQEWLRGLFALAVEDLRQHCATSDKAIHFTLFERYDLDGPNATENLSYARLAEEFGLPATQVTNHLAYARRQFRRLLLERLRASTGGEEEYQQEVRRLFGEEPR